ncbi:MAG: TIGR00282 family metallophosphoesterase [Deltaproteobacteria bacterium]|nr:TIGR00282 family metallophosphoesterase [Deltaproteobacteria bacterium]MBW1953069.1 TIGR00282 family metallophosphoesterase [Deltaproteobacteria bacterium]MBW1986709.1 TIGR00282 family metallophosphoesterase [Deltaproteobacteria bacterium]MBW2134555.1 TIGR00282 family metallophosphoesterase [Deltaproteobacteria bacterium]
MKIFFIGDIMGAPGRRAIAQLLHKVVDRYQIDLVVANGENVAGGIGITPVLADQLLGQGIDILTSGNHLWKHKEILPYLAANNRLLRPANYPPGTPGEGLTVVETAAGEPAAIINLEGRVFMSALDCPFRCADQVLATLPPQVRVILVDMHAEATSEKQALGWYLDGRVSAVIGTHTHVQTADERILPRGTGYLTDAGFTGSCDSVIGMKREVIIERFLTQRPQQFKVATQNIQLQGVVLTISPEGRCLDLTRIQLPLD